MHVVTVFKKIVRKTIPESIYRPVYQCLARIYSIKYFLCDKYISLSLVDRLRLYKRILVISKKIDCAHAENEIVQVINALLSQPACRKGVIVEAGTYQGGSAVKLSIVAKITGRTLCIFDSFEGIPDNYEPHEKDIFGDNAGFKKGDLACSLGEVKKNITSMGEISCCKFYKGWFEDTMPKFHEKNLPHLFRC